MSNIVNGSCLCGEVTCNVTGPFDRFYQCHCDRCQKKSGSAFASLLFTSYDNLVWLSGEKSTKRFDLPNAERFSNAFCTHCGSQVPYISRDGKFLVTPAGFLNDDPQIVPQANIFIGEKACWFEAGQTATNFERYPT